MKVKEVPPTPFRDGEGKGGRGANGYKGPSPLFPHLLKTTVMMHSYLFLCTWVLALAEFLSEINGFDQILRWNPFEK